MPDADERELIQGLIERRKEAERRFWDSHYEGVYRHVLALLARNGSVADAEDIAQETFLRAYRDIGKFRGASKLRTWLITLARHAAADYYRVKANKYPPPGTIRDPQALEMVAADPDAFGSSPMEEVLAVERRDQLHLLFAQLPKDYHRVLVLRIVDRLPVQETSELMGKTPGAVKMMLMRALRALSVEVQAPDSYFLDSRGDGKGEGHDGA